jgi:16S rRNA pseudouridine516 synthase
MPKRIDQLLSALGYASRREVAAWCAAGRVTDAAGRPLARPDARVEAAALRVDGEPLDRPDGVFVLLHKPVGHTCSHDPAEAPLVYDLLPARWSRRNPVVASVGRLDKDSSGALLFTDDGALAHRLTAPKRHVEKTYLVETDRPLEPALAARFAAGDLVLRGETTPCQPAGFELVGGCRARVVLTEGRYHQVRRMFAACGWHVTALHREAFGPWRVDDLAPGQWREVPRP